MSANLLLQSSLEKLDPSSSVSLVEQQELVVVGGNVTVTPCSTAAGAGSILDTRNTIGVQSFDGTAANWESCRMKYDASPDLARMGAHLDLAAEQTAFIMGEGLEAPSMLVSKTVQS